MKPYSLVNSKAVGQHLFEIGYHFSPLETAWLIYKCQRLSYEEKKALWSELMDSMEDYPLPSVEGFEGAGSLHAFLKSYIMAADSEYESFIYGESSNRYVYMYSIRLTSGRKWNSSTIFTSLRGCIEAVRQEIEGYYYHWQADNEEALRYTIKRQSTCNLHNITYMQFFPDGRFVGTLLNKERSYEDIRILDYSFKHLGFVFPAPFKKGDILWVPPENGSMTRFSEEPFVLMGTESASLTESVIKYVDCNINAWGYFVRGDSRIYAERTLDYMISDYYPYADKLCGHHIGRILIEISRFVKGEVELGDFINGYRENLLAAAAHIDGYCDLRLSELMQDS